MDNNHSNFSNLEIPITVKLFNLYESTHKIIFSFPKHEKYSLGEKIENAILDGIELSILASSAGKFDKEKILQKLNCKTELLKILFRIVLNCKIIDAQKYLEIESSLQEIGKMTQGWIKYSRNMK